MPVAPYIPALNISSFVQYTATHTKYVKAHAFALKLAVLYNLRAATCYVSRDLYYTCDQVIYILSDIEVSRVALSIVTCNGYVWDN